MNDNGPAYLIIPAAGLGTRVKSVRSDLPKELLPVGRKPAIQYAVEEGLAAGIHHIIIIISRRKEIIRRYFEDTRVSAALFPDAGRELEKIRKRASLTFLYQKEPRGESDAIGCAAEIAGGSAVAVIHPDDIYFPAPGVVKALRPVYSQYGTDVIALMQVTERNARGLDNSGRVDLRHIREDIYRIEKFVPKGGGRFISRFPGELRSCGMSISGPHIFEYIERLRHEKREGEFTNLPVLNLTVQERGYIGRSVPGTFFDIGNPGGYELCLQYLQKGSVRAD